MWQPKVPPISVPAPSSGRSAARGRPRPLYLRIVDALASDVASGRVAPETRLPTQRELAERLGTTIATVTRAYSEARRRGLVSATVGRGTFVHAAPAHAASGVTDLTLNQMIATPFGGELIAAASTIDPDLLASLLEYQPHGGSERHRRVMARWAGLRGVPAALDEIVVTAGAQHSLLAALATLTRPGDAVLTEAVTYTGAISVANHLHLRLVPVAVDAGGLDVDAFARAAKRTGARVAYLMPTLQNPTGVTLAAGRRKALLQAAAKYDVTLIEDDEYGVFSSTLPLAADAPDRCIYLTGVSKAIAPGLRVGLLRAPASLVPRLGAAVFASSVMAPPFGAEVVGRWLADGLAERVIAWKRAEFQARTVLARQILGSGGFGMRDVPPISPHVWLPTGPLGGVAFMEQARLRGVIVSAGQSFAVGGGPAPPFVRVCLGPPSTREALAQALGVLADVRARPPMPHAATV
jgi:DNA-binding transcriptional MocR family regulator